MEEPVVEAVIDSASPEDLQPQTLEKLSSDIENDLTTAVPDQDTVIADMDHYETVVPATPPLEEGTVIDVTVSSRRKSTRPRKPQQPKEAVVVASETKKKVRGPKKSLAESVPVKRTPKRKSAVAGSPEAADVAVEPSTKKKRKNPTIAPQIIVDISVDGPSDQPPIEAGEGEVVIPIRVQKSLKKSRPADVPPIDCLSFWKQKKVVKRKSVHVVSHTDTADVPPSPTVDSEVLIPVETKPEEPIKAADIIATEPTTPGDQLEKKLSKKQIQEEAFRKSQPSVLRFFAKPDDLSDQDISRSSGLSLKKIASPGERFTYTVSNPTFGLYAQVWRESKNSMRVKPRVFITRPRGDSSGIVRSTDVVFIPSKTLTIYSGEFISARKKAVRPRPVYIAIHDRERPPVKLIMTHQSRTVNRRRPLATDAIIDYEKDSDEEWEEEKEGEDLNSNVDAEEEAELDENGSEADSFFVSDGHFSDADELSDDEAVVARRRRQEMNVDEDGKATLQLVIFGPSDLENLDTADCSDDSLINVKWFKTIRDEAGFAVFDDNNFFKINNAEEEKKPRKEPINKVEKIVIDWAVIRPELARFVHGKASNVDSLAAEFKTVRAELTGNSIKTEIRSIASWVKRPEIQSRVAWYVKPDLFEVLGLAEDDMNALANERKIVKEVNKENAPGTAQNNQMSLMQFKQIAETSVPTEEREPIRN